MEDDKKPADEFSDSMFSNKDNQNTGAEQPQSTTDEQSSSTEQIPETPVTETQQLSQRPKKRRLSKQTMLIAGSILLALLVGASATAAYFILSEEDTDTTTSENIILNDEGPIVSAEIAEDEKIVASNPDYAYSIFDQQSGEVWYQSRREIDRPGFLSTVSEYEDNAYYEVGERDGKTIVMHAMFGLGESIRFFEVSADGSATAMLNFNNQYTNDEDYGVAELEQAGITIDRETVYDSLTFPSDGFTLDNDLELYGSRWGVYILDGPYDYSSTTDEFFKDTEKLQDTDNGAFYSNTRVIEYEDPIIELREVAFYYRTPIGVAFSLTYTPFGSKTVSDVTFTRGGTHLEDDSGTYEPITRGCGFSSAYTHYPKITDADVTPVGTGNNGETVYGLVDTNYKILTKYVEEIESFTEQIVTKQELLDNNALIFYKNVFNQWEVYGAPRYTQFGGCAKPVVYLYPEQPTIVNVQVGADVKISDPHYERDGWQGVLAEPNGYLHYRGKIYDSLFWEGPGHGLYPVVTNGVIVKTEQAIDRIKVDMATMGFNDKEIADFVAYWQDKLPTKAYTRLTWLQTDEMNALAPLSVQPRPDSVLRAFLDFEGLNAPYALPSQTLETVERKGFTVTEWGGLTPFDIY